VAGADNAYREFRKWAGTMLAHRRGENAVHHDAERARTVYQTSTMGALLNGIYDGEVTIADLLEHGDFGLGTFNHLDGEMVVLDGICYRLRADGSAQVADPAALTPFAVVTHFAADTVIPVSEPVTRTELTSHMDTVIQGSNLVYAVRVTGTFGSVSTRTVMEQERPYPPLAEATQGQAEEVFTGVDGTLAGFRTPDYEQVISVAGYHLHFINDGRTKGGHVRDFSLRRGRVEISSLSEIHLSLPRSGPFLNADLSPSGTAEKIREAEG
jgi:acetolactate decarboxylase